MFTGASQEDFWVTKLLKGLPSAHLHIEKLLVFFKFKIIQLSCVRLTVCVRVCKLGHIDVHLYCRTHLRQTETVCCPSLSFVCTSPHPSVVRWPDPGSAHWPGGDLSVPHCSDADALLGVTETRTRNRFTASRYMTCGRFWRAAAVLI